MHKKLKFFIIVVKELSICVSFGKMIIFVQKNENDYTRA